MNVIVAGDFQWDKPGNNEESFICTFSCPRNREVSHNRCDCFDKNYSLSFEAARGGT